MPKSLATQEWKRMAWGRFPHFRSEEGKYEATSTLVLASETATLQMSIGSNPPESRPCVTAVLGLMCKLSPFLHFFLIYCFSAALPTLHSLTSASSPSHGSSVSISRDLPLTKGLPTRGICSLSRNIWPCEETISCGRLMPASSM